MIPFSDIGERDEHPENRLPRPFGQGRRFFRLSKNFDALLIQADQDKRERGTGKRKQENAVGANIDQLTIYRYGA